MKTRLGLPDTPEGHTLGKRLAVLTFLRLVFLSILLAILANWNLQSFHLHDFSVKLGLGALAVAFLLAGLYAGVLRSGNHYRQLAYVQVVMDQVIWTVLVYLSGGANSSATALFGLTTLTASILDGLPAAVTAASAGFVLYVLMSALMVLGVLPVPPDQTTMPYVTTFSGLVTPLSLNLLVIIVVTLLSGYLAERLRLVRGEVSAANERAQRAEHLARLGQIAAGLAHEIRNPLGAVAASIELLRDSPALDEDDRHLCEIIQAETRRLDDLVSDMLNLSRNKRLSIAPVDIGAIARDVALLATQSGRAVRDVTVTTDVADDDAPIVVSADSQQLKQLIWNLVRNAIQATEPNTTVTIRIRKPDDETPLVEVQDQGPGIPKEAREHLFDPFFTTRSHGSGIGLAVVQRIATNHGWLVDAVSCGNAENMGTRFRVFTTGGERPTAC